MGSVVLPAKNYPTYLTLEGFFVLLCCLCFSPIMISSVITIRVFFITIQQRVFRSCDTKPTLRKRDRFVFSETLVYQGLSNSC
jgi:hypothetical protein